MVVSMGINYGDNLWIFQPGYLAAYRDCMDYLSITI